MLRDTEVISNRFVNCKIKRAAKLALSLWTETVGVYPQLLWVLSSK